MHKLNKIISSIVLFGFVLMAFLSAPVSVLGVQSPATVKAEAAYGNFRECEERFQGIKDPVRRQQRIDECNRRIEERINRRIEQLTRQATRDIQNIVRIGTGNIRALVLSVMNNLFWEIWNLYNVIYPRS